MRIYVPLLNEGTPVWRPVEAEHLGDDRYRIMQEQPKDEDWPVASGQVVRCTPHRFADGVVGLIAVIPVSTAL
jgi:hypothetical protein